MKLPTFKKTWPDSVKQSYQYDQLELFGDTSIPGYTYAFKQRFYRIITQVQQHLPAGSTILDVAAAQGNFSVSLAEAGYQVYWNDLRSELIPYVKEKNQSESLYFLPGEVFSLNLNQLFDGVIITEIIEHVAHPDQFLKKIASLVKENGYIFMTTPNGRYFGNKLPRFSDCKNPEIYESMQFRPNADGHIFLLYPTEIVELAKATGLEVVAMNTYTNFFTNGHLKTHLLLRFFPESLVTGLERITQLLPERIKNRLNTNTCAVFKKKY